MPKVKVINPLNRFLITGSYIPYKVLRGGSVYNVDLRKSSSRYRNYGSHIRWGFRLCLKRK